MLKFLHSGSLGDIIYSLPTIKALGGGILYVKRALFFDGYDQFTALEDLLRCQPYLHDVRPYPAQYAQFEHDPDIEITHDLDVARLQPNRGRVHIIKRHLDALKVPCSTWREPWLTVPSFSMPYSYNLVNLTPRYRENSGVNWYRVLRHIPPPVFFVGFEQEYRAFCAYAGTIPYVRTANLLELARVIYGAAALYCNQSVALTLAQGMGKPYHLERHVRRTNCLLNTQNEHLL